MDGLNDEEPSNDSEISMHPKAGSSTEEDGCIICLQRIQDRAILPLCSHDSQCFSCLVEWTKHSSKCPLCVSDIGPFIIHKIRSKHDYKRYFISPALSPTALSQSRSLAESQRIANDHRLQREEERRRAEIEAAILRRRRVHHYGLFAKHVATNRFTGFVPHPTPTQIAASIELQRRARAFLRRELRVWINLDVEFLTNYIIALIKMLDLRTEPGIRLLADLMDPGTLYSEEARKPNTEHLAHELYSFLRSPYKQLEAYDKIVQYDAMPLSRRTYKPLGQPNAHHQSGRGSVSPPRMQSGQDRSITMQEGTESHSKHSRDGKKKGEARMMSSAAFEHQPQVSACSTGLSSISSGPQGLTVPGPSLEDEDAIPSRTLIPQSSHTHGQTADPSDSRSAPIKRARPESPPQSELDMDIDGRQESEIRSPEDPPAFRITLSQGQLTPSRREELLARLKREQAKLNTAGLSRDTDMDDVSAIGTSQVSEGLQIRGAAAKARELMERRLSAQALLRVKLARGKSRLAETQECAHSVPMEPGAAPAQVGVLDGVPVSSVDSSDERLAFQHKLREKLLKERLLLARANPPSTSFL